MYALFSPVAGTGRPNRYKGEAVNTRTIAIVALVLVVIVLIILLA